MHNRSYCLHNIIIPVTGEKIGIIVLEGTEEGRFSGLDAAEIAARINELFNAHIVYKKNC